MSYGDLMYLDQVVGIMWHLTWPSLLSRPASCLHFYRTINWKVLHDIQTPEKERESEECERMIPHLMSARSDSRDPTWSPDTSGRRETHFQSRVSYAIMRHFLHTRAIWQISLWDR